MANIILRFSHSYNHTEKTVIINGKIEKTKNYIWNSQLSVAINNCLEVVCAVVTIATQVEAKRPIGRHHRQTN